VEEASLPVPEEESSQDVALPLPSPVKPEFEVVIDVEVATDSVQVHTYTERAEFNRKARNAEYIRYRTPKIGDAVYKRKTPWGAVEPYELFVNFWSIKKGNEFHKDFDIYSSFEEAEKDENRWLFCNGDDKGVGFPRDCGATKKKIWRWFAFPKTSTHEGSKVDFIPRFDTKYMRSKCYSRATFEILEKEVVTEGSEVHHHHHHHHHHNIGHCGCGCGSLVGLFFAKQNSSWLTDLFAQRKDDAEWLTELMVKKEITQEQYEWLLELFENKTDMDGEYADKWWRSIFTQKYTGSFDKESIPAWVKKHSEKKKEYYEKLGEEAVKSAGIVLI